uniref:Uncharacterized protein n=1 Tax=viral metagenome TaxID=1070528 RepID=A0A6M3L8V5_9ZZZZ
MATMQEFFEATEQVQRAVSTAERLVLAARAYALYANEATENPAAVEIIQSKLTPEQRAVLTDLIDWCTAHNAFLENALTVLKG